MTKECKHCKIDFTINITNDNIYCENCYKTIQSALSKIPILFQTIQTDASHETTLQKLLSIKQTLLFKQIKPGLFNYNTQDSQSIIKINNLWLSYWEKSPEYTITKDLKVHYKTTTPKNPSLSYKKPITLIDPSKSYPKPSISSQKHLYPPQSLIYPLLNPNSLY